MSIFGNIMGAIFGSKAPPGTTAAAPGGAAQPTPAPGSPAATVDVEAILVKMADDNDEDLNWRQSIVDLMKLLDLDSSLGARKELAQELGYTGALNGSRRDEHLAAQAGHAEAGRERRQGARSRCGASRAASALGAGCARRPRRSRARSEMHLPPIEVETS